MHVKERSGLDDVYNFKTFGQSMILLFQVSITFSQHTYPCGHPLITTFYQDPETGHPSSRYLASGLDWSSGELGNFPTGWKLNRPVWSDIDKSV